MSRDFSYSQIILKKMKKLFMLDSDVGVIRLTIVKFYANLVSSVQI